MQLQLVHQHGVVRLMVILGVVDLPNPGRPSTMINFVFISNPLQISKMIAASSYSVEAS